MGLILRALLLMALAYVLWRGWQQWRAAAGRPVPGQEPAGPEALRACRACGRYAPLALGHIRRGDFYCCAAHLPAESPDENPIRQ